MQPTKEEIAKAREVYIRADKFINVVCDNMDCPSISSFEMLTRVFITNGCLCSCGKEMVIQFIYE